MLRPLVFDLSGLETLVTCHLVDPSPAQPPSSLQPHANSVTLRQLACGPIHDRPGCDISLSKEGHILNVQHEHLRVRNRCLFIRRGDRPICISFSDWPCILSDSLSLDAFSVSQVISQANYGVVQIDVGGGPGGGPLATIQSRTFKDFHTYSLCCRG